MKQALAKIFPWFLLIIFLFFSLFAYTKLVGPISFSVSSVSTTKTDIFSVSGEGKAIVKPDIALVNVGIEANGATVKETQNQINTVINKVSTALKGLGIAEKDIKTVNYSINPNYDWGSGRQRIIGYHANTTLEVKVRDIDKANEVIDSATASGANQIGNITFDVEDKTKAEAEARQQAVDEAKKKAGEIAKASGLKLGKIINYSEGSSGLPVPMVRESMKLGLGGGAAPTTDIQPGSSEIRIVVNLSYQLE